MADPENRVNPSSPSPADTPSTTAGTSATGDHAQRDEIRDRARQTADEIRDAARQQAEGMFNRQKSVAAEQTEKLATVFRKMAKEFDQQDQYYFSGYANNLARCTDGISQRLREKDLEGLVSQVQEYSRRQPAMFIGGAIAAGFILSRFLRSSSERSMTTHARHDNGPSPGSMPY